MVHKELLITEYWFEGDRFQWAHITIGKGKGALSILIDYDSREGTDKWFTLRMGGKIIITQQEWSDFDLVVAVIEDRRIVIYDRETGFNSEALQQDGRFLRWNR